MHHDVWREMYLISPTKSFDTPHVKTHRTPFSQARVSNHRPKPIPVQNKALLAPPGRSG